MAAVTGKQLINVGKIFTDGDFVNYEAMKRLIDSGLLADLRDAFVAGKAIDRTTFRNFLNLQPVRRGLDISRLPTWRKVQIGTRRTGTELGGDIVLAGMNIGRTASEFLESLLFHVGAEREVELLIISVRELGILAGGTLREVMKAANEIPNCLPCDAEAGPCIRSSYKDQPRGESLYVAMNPLIPTSSDSPSIFTIDYRGSKPMLNTVAAATFFPPVARFIFMRHIPKQGD